MPAGGDYPAANVAGPRVAGPNVAAFTVEATQPFAMQPRAAPTPAAAPPRATAPAPAPAAPPPKQVALPPAKDSVPIILREEGKQVWVDVLLGGQPLRMLLDTGATISTVTDAIATKIVRDGQGSYGDKGKVKLADGSVREVYTIMVRELRIGSHVVSNVRATVTDSLLLAFPIVDGIAPFTIDTRARELIWHKGSEKTAVNQVELTKPNPDWSKVGAKLSDQCVREIISKRVSPYCEAEGKAWSEGLKAKLNDPRFVDEMEREFGRYMR
jgi:hypothetical protein